MNMFINNILESSLAHTPTKLEEIKRAELNAQIKEVAKQKELEKKHIEDSKAASEKPTPTPEPAKRPVKKSSRPVVKGAKIPPTPVVATPEKTPEEKKAEVLEELKVKAAVANASKYLITINNLLTNN